MARPRRSSPLRALVVVLGLVVAGCSGSASEGTREAAATSTATPDVATTETSAPPSAYAPSWSAVHADAANSDRSPVEPAADVARRWTIDIEGSMRIGALPWTINLGPTSDPEGNLYVTTTETGCHLRALDGRTGERRWCADLDLFAVVSSPLIDRDGNLYLADGTGMHALAPDGARLWDTTLRGVPLSAQFTPDGHVVFVTHLGTVYVLDRATGAPVLDPVDLAPDLTWEPGQGMAACARGTEACPSANTLAVDQETGVLYFTFWTPGAEHAGVRAMQYEGGDEPALRPLWTNEGLPGGSASSPAISSDGRRVYVTDNADGLHALDAATGEIVWSVSIGYAAGGSPSVSPEGLVMPAGGGNGTVLAVRDEGDRGVIAWQRDDLLNRGIPTQTAGGRVYATVGTGGAACDLVVLDAADGRELDREPLPGTCVFSVGTTIGVDGTVYVPTIVGGLHAFR